MFQITNKIKKYFSGNWGHPTAFEKRHTEIPKDFFDDKEPKWHSVKRKQVPEKKTAYWDECPFCFTKLEKLPDRDGCWILHDYLPECACGAIEVPDCPACHRDTWFKDGVYKHKWLGCGFIGKRIVHNEGEQK